MDQPATGSGCPADPQRPNRLAGVAGLPRARIVVTSPLVLLTRRPGCERRGRARVRLWPLPRTLCAGRSDERPSPESSPPAASGGRAEAQRSRPERPALSKSAVGPARACGPPGSGAPLDRTRAAGFLVGINRLIAATAGHGDPPHPPRLDLAVSARSGSSRPSRSCPCGGNTGPAHSAGAGARPRTRSARRCACPA